MKVICKYYNSCKYCETCRYASPVSFSNLQQNSKCYSFVNEQYFNNYNRKLKLSNIKNSNERNL